MRKGRCVESQQLISNEKKAPSPHILGKHSEAVGATTLWHALHVRLSEVAKNTGSRARPRAAGKPPKKMGGDAPHLFGRFPGRPGPPRAPKSTISGLPKSHILETQVCKKNKGLSIAYSCKQLFMVVQPQVI